MIFTISSKKYGQFLISFELINTRPEKVKEVMGNMIVVNAEPDYINKGIIYVAISELFYEVQEGAKIPNYNLKFENGQLRAIKL
jgi:hypothetical protein